MRFFDDVDGVRVKICGITTAKDAQALVTAGVDAIGVNHWPKSKRYVTPEASAPWLGELAGAITRIGLFVNATLEEIEEAMDFCVLDAIQLHGDESPAFCQDVSAFGLPVIKAIGVKDGAPVHKPASFPTKNILLDAYAPDEYGGTGRTFEWEVAHKVKASLKNGFLILAGGLTPENATDAVAAVHPNALDIASGVESAPGIKDMTKVTALMQALGY